MAKTLRVAVQMDPMESIGIEGDSTFALMLEAQARGHALWHYHVRDLALAGGRVTAWAHPVEVRREVLAPLLPDIELLEELTGESFGDWKGDTGRGDFRTRTAART